MNAQSYDVIILGLGGMGSAAAFHLAHRGKRVLGLEQYTEAHSQGSSHGGSRVIRQAYHENPAYVPLVQRAYELWEQLERDSESDDLLHLTGGLMIGLPGSSVVEGTVASAIEHNLPYETLDARELKRRYPVLNPRPDEQAVFELRAGFLRPEQCVRAHLRQAARHGAELHFNERLADWQADPGGLGINVITDQGRYYADRLILAPGAWASQLLPSLQIPFDVRRHVMCWFEPSGELTPFLPENFPIYLWELSAQDVFYGFPATDGSRGGVKVAMHSGGEPCTPSIINREISNADVETLRRHLAAFIPSLNGPLLSAVTCMYTLTPDEHFILSLHPDHPQVAIAAGFSGHGFKFTSVVGEILADLTTAGNTRHPISLFSPQRFAASLR